MTLNCFRHSGWILAVLILLLTACTSQALVPGTQRAPSTTSPARSLPPTPSATPLAPTLQPTPGPDAYRLKAWTEQDALAAISQAEKIDPNAPTPPERSPYDKQDYLVTLEQEALLRFPSAQSREEIEWKAARDATIPRYGTLDKGAPVDSFVSLLTKALDSSQVTPGMLETWLPNKGFDVTSRHSAPNLFGDGQTVDVLQIDTQDWLVPVEILLAIAKPLPSGSYRLVSVRPYWLTFDPHGQTTENVSVVDHNGNERPEVQIIEENDFPALCRSQLSLYEWKSGASNGRFENIAEQVSPIEGDYSNSSCQDPWQFAAPDARSTQPLTATLRYNNWAGADCPEYEYKVRYEWDGAAYRWASGGASLPGKQSPQCSVGWAYAAAKHGLYDQAIPLVESALAGWPKELDSIWGPSAQDLFRFKLGTWYAFQGEDDRAVAVLQDVRDRPVNPAFKMLPQVADTFLSRYQMSNDPLRACVAVYGLLKQEFDQTPDSGGLAASGRTIAAWGFAEPDWLTRLPRLDEVCDRGWRPDTPSDLQSPPTTPEPPPTLSPEQTQQVTISLIEKTLFVDGDSRQASQLIERLLAKGVIEPDYVTTDVIKPYLQYLLGLAYELSGDERRAVDNYWHLSHDYPDSLYSKIAQEKMERIAP